MKREKEKGLIIFVAIFIVVLMGISFVPITEFVLKTLDTARKQGALNHSEKKFRFELYQGKENKEKLAFEVDNEFKNYFIDIAKEINYEVEKDLRLNEETSLIYFKKKKYYKILTEK